MLQQINYRYSKTLSRNSALLAYQRMFAKSMAKTSIKRSIKAPSFLC